jgi:hypothetical protein
MSTDLSPSDELIIHRLRSTSAGHTEVWEKFKKANHLEPNKPHLELYDEHWWKFWDNRDRVAFTFETFVTEGCSNDFKLTFFVPPEWKIDVLNRICDIKRLKAHLIPDNHSNWKN